MNYDIGGAGITGAPAVDGHLVVERDEDGTLRVVRADDYVALSLNTLGLGPDEGLTTDPSGMLLFAGQVGYLPIRFKNNGLTVVCRKAWTIQAGNAA